LEGENVQDLILTAKDNGKSFSASLGNTIIIKIPENPTTGFRWELEEFDNNALEVQQSGFSAQSTTLTGSGGEKSFIIKTQKIGQTFIRLKLWRDWEGDSSVIERYEVNIEVLR
jgi:inhibitor of cysteine peptidase